MENKFNRYFGCGIPENVGFNRNKNYDELMKEQGRILIKMMQDRYKKKEEKMLDKNQQKIVIDQLQIKLNILRATKNNRVSQIAVLGSSLKGLLDEIAGIEEVLDKMKPCDDCDD